MNPEPIELFVRVVDLTGVLMNAILGGVIARAKRFDPVGFLTLAIMSGLGGGMIRDVLLQVGPPLALTDPAYLLVAIAGTVVAFMVPVSRRLWDPSFPYLDALALGCWSAAGASKALAAGLGWLPAVMMGTITAIGGGMLRDIVLRKTPAVFGGNTLYATSAILASLVLVLLQPLAGGAVATLAASVVGMLMTLLARRLDWRLPEPYAWSPKRALAMLPRPRWRLRGKPASGRGRHGPADRPA
ncbi:MAG: TRIC cation channel family protein [Actinobacteria bacterium]|nr:TRIC cation channel family protein [Actinomycetota bacterium]